MVFQPSSETQGQIVGARESLNGRENVARRKVKNGEKSPWGQCLTRPVPNGRRRSGFWLVPENLCFSGTNQKPERRRPFGTGLIRHCPQGLFSPFFTFLRAIFFHPFRLSLAPTICPWVSEDVFQQKLLEKSIFHCQNDWSNYGPADQFWILESALQDIFTDLQLRCYIFNQSLKTTDLTFYWLLIN